MHSYETIMAIPSSFSEKKVDEKIAQVKKIIEKNDGKISSSESLGEIQMAYKVDNHLRAFYHIIEFKAPGELVDELREHYRLNKAYIRDMTVRTDK